jgi:hypothetical protein
MARDAYLRKMALSGRGSLYPRHRDNIDIPIAREIRNPGRQGRWLAVAWILGAAGILLTGLLRVLRRRRVRAPGAQLP